jgi:hypothetical protein
MTSDAALAKRWRKRLWRIAITSALMGVSFVVGVAITAYIAFQLLLPMVAAGITVGMVGVTSAATHAVTTSLCCGDSATRLDVLTRLKQAFDAEPAMVLDCAASAWILPALEQCKTDPDPKVVSLAEELAIGVKQRTPASPH